MGRIVPMNQTALRHMRKKERHGRSFLWIRMNRQRVSTGYAELNIYNRLYNKDNLLVYEKQVKAMQNRTAAGLSIGARARRRQGLSRPMRLYSGGLRRLALRSLPRPSRAIMPARRLARRWAI